MTTTQITFLVSAVFVFACILHAALWLRLRIAIHHLQMVRMIAEENREHVPDDLIHTAEGKTFQRASEYWSSMVLRVLPQTS